VEAEIHDYDTEPGDIYLPCSGRLRYGSDDDIGLALQTLRPNLKLCPAPAKRHDNAPGQCFGDNGPVLRGPQHHAAVGKMMGWLSRGILAWRS
jgi:hypothetical protein